MQPTKAGLFGFMMLVLCTAAGFAQQGGGAGAGRGAGAGGGLVSMPVLQPEPSDKAIIFT